MKRFEFQTEVDETTLRDVLGFVTASAIQHHPGRISVDGWWNTPPTTRRGTLDVIDGIVRFYPARGSIEGAGKPAAELYREELTWKFNYFEPESKYIRTVMEKQLPNYMGMTPDEIHIWHGRGPDGESLPSSCRCLIDISRWGMASLDVLGEDLTDGRRTLVGLLLRHGYEYTHPTANTNIIHVYRSIV